MPLKDTPSECRIFSAGLCADVHKGEHLVLNAWIDRWQELLPYLSENTGCGCCVDLYSAVAPIEAINELPTTIVDNVFPVDCSFYISFSGATPSDSLSAFIEYTNDFKTKYGNESRVVDRIAGSLSVKEGYLYPPRFENLDEWIDLLNTSTFLRVTSGEFWPFERLVSDILGGAYELAKLQ